MKRYPMQLILHNKQFNFCLDLKEHTPFATEYVNGRVDSFVLASGFR